MWIIRCGSCSRGGKETDDSEYSFFFSSVHFKHFLSFFLYFTCYYSQPFYISPFENMITIEHDSKLFFAIFNNSIRIIIVTLYRLQLEFNGIIRNTIDITVKCKIIVDTFFFHPSFVKLFPFLDSLVTPFEASVEDPSEVLVPRLAAFQLAGIIVGIIRPRRLLTLDRGGVIERKGEEGAKAAASAANELSATIVIHLFVQIPGYNHLMPTFIAVHDHGHCATGVALVSRTHAWPRSPAKELKALG